MKKRILSLLCTAVLIVSLFLPVVAMASDSLYYVYTENGKPLNMRPTPSTKEKKIMNIPFGAKVRIEYYENNSWARITYNNTQGYVMIRYLVDYKPVKEGTHIVVAEPADNGHAGFKVADYDVLVRASTAGGYVNLRSGPSKKDSVLMRVTDTTLLHVIAEGDGWAQVVDPATNTTGFMMRSFLVRYKAN